MLMPMTSDQAMAALEAAGTAQNCKIYARHGAEAPMFGVSYATLKALAKQAGRDQALAEALWDTGNHDARILATMVADPAVAKATVVNRWVSESTNFVLADAVSGVAAGTPQAEKLADKLRASSRERPAAIGWNIVAHLATQDRLPADRAMEMIGEIERGIHAAPNRTRYSMNNALIAIGLLGGELEKAAIAAATRIGTVHVDHGETGCKTPAAADYIAKGAARAAARRAKGTSKPAKRLAKA